MRSIAWFVFIVILVCILAGRPQSAMLLLSTAGAAFLFVLGAGLISVRGANGSSARKGFQPEELSANLAVTDAKGRLLYTTTAFRHTAGMDDGESNLRRLGEGAPECREAVYRLFEAARATRKHAETLRLGGKDVRVSVNPLRGLPSAAPYLQWTLDDSPETAHSSNGAGDAHDTENFPPRGAGFLQTVWHDAPVAMARIDQTGAVLDANVEFRKLFDPSGAFPAGRPKLSKLFKDDGAFAQFHASLFKSAGKAPEAVSIRFECEASTRGARPRHLRLTALASRASQGVMLFATETGVATVLDEQTLQNQKLQAVGELAGGIAHDFNNLLTSIIGFSDLLLARFRQSDPAFNDLMNIKNNANRAASLVSQILAYSRKQTLRPTLVVLTDVIQDFHSSVGRLLGEKITAKIDHGRDLWFVKADEHQLFQVIMNLAVNARDAMPDGGTLTIRTANVTSREAAKLKARGLPSGEYVLCEVRDTGTGIAPDTLQRIFDPFFSTKEVGKGTGLGLSTVYGIVKQTGGTILVDSKVGSGTAFCIYLPRHRETEDELEARVSKAVEKPAAVDLTGSSTVLLVEDEESVRSFASRALASRGYKVLEAASGVEALEVMDREGGTVDLVVSDVVMPEMDGPTLLRHLRQRNPKVKIVFMSGYAEEAFRKNLDPGEAFTFLPKPFTLKTLAETVKKAAA